MSNSKMYPGRTALLDYLREHDSKLWSYVEFLTLNRADIVKSPPFKDNWGTLNGTWHRRYLQAGKELLQVEEGLNSMSGDDFEKKMDWERDKSKLHSFWRDVIVERSQLPVQRTYYKETVFRKRLLPYRDQTMETTSKCALVSDLISPASVKKRVRKDGPKMQYEYEMDGDFSDFGSSAKTPSDDFFDDISDNYKNGSDIDEDTRVKVDKNAFYQEFKKIPETEKLKLSTGKVVEDVLFNYVKDKDYEHHAHSYIVNCDDQEIRKLFNDKEWKELTKDQLGIPKVPLDIATEISKYGNKDLEELRKAVMVPYLSSDVFYDSNQHRDLEWIQLAIRTIVDLYENDKSPLKRNHYEYWYTIVLFGTCIDFVFRDAKLKTDIKRLDASSCVSSNSKNCTKNTKRKLTEQKIDGIVYSVDYLDEMGVIQGAKSLTEVYDKKYLHEYFKMPKSLRNMLADLIRAVDYNSDKASKIQVFGIIHLGLKVQFSRLWRAGGSITIFKKDFPFYEISSEFSVDKFKFFLKFLISVYQYKMILKNNIQVLYMLEEEESLKEDTLLNELLNVGRQQMLLPNTINYFADCFKPSRKSKKSKQKKRKLSFF